MGSIASIAVTVILSLFGSAILGITVAVNDMVELTPQAVLNR